LAGNEIARLTEAALDRIEYRHKVDARHPVRVPVHAPM
jgi:hypothetical protein